MAKSIAKKIYPLIPLKRQVFSAVKKFASPGENIYRHLHFEGDFTVSVDADRSFRMRHYGYEIENTLFWEGLNGGWERTALAVWSQLSKNSKVILDIGANTGIYSLIAAALNPSAEILAFEPIHRICDKLRHNVALNDFNIKCFELAASDRDGKAAIFDSPHDHTYSSTFHNEIFGGEDVNPTEVEVARMDTFLKSNISGAVDLIKIDVEGHEPAVLRGFGDHLTKFSPSILIEILTDDVGAEAEMLLKGTDYSFFYLDERRQTAERTDRLIRRESYNYLVCPPAVAAQLQFPRAF